ncbi:hypothetical protein BGZ46_001096, partial [Entomortierella lignicola]
MESLNRYHKLFDETGTDSSDNQSCSTVEVGEPQIPTPSRKDLAARLKLTKSHKVTAPQINDITHSRKTSKRRERRLKQSKNENVRDALKEISSKDNSMRHAMTIQDVEQAHRRNTQNREVLRSFEQSDIRQKEMRNHDLREKRTWQKLGTAERRYSQRYGDAALEQNPTSVSDPKSTSIVSITDAV